ncbi:hypothetical protein PV08_03766 [Exophiala spinifera]|uniref:Aminoglycoside phosphotransferase domain-containing protein n=1 Tax=Exophiala spinifera TaxID=91928 RepID=A0A0D2BC91_9EURO|nr:uncharacterized protein PV08_03766 [Exophiala spinifera]KIW16578.1 hypothetical protein PV08_03766 [Exophiala spinifera]
MRTSEKVILLYLQARLWSGKKFFGSLGPSVTRVSGCRVNKGPCESAEIEAERYVAQRTSIPVPKVYHTYQVDGRFYVEMEYVKGDTLQALWASGALSPDEKKALVMQVAGYIDQLRMLKPPHKEIVASADLGRCLDYRVGYRPLGPFTSNEEFHPFLRGYIHSAG